MKRRLDDLLVERGLAETRAKARALVLAGKVPGYSKAGTQVEEAVELKVEPGKRFVSRGGEKLDSALQTLGIDVAGQRCLDLGASTGGFTDCLLQRGASAVCAVDVGYGQLDLRLRQDARVTVIERYNARRLRCDDLPYAPEFITCDVSFISVEKVLPPALSCAAGGWSALILVKPQFEAGPKDVRRGGVVHDPSVHRRVLDRVRQNAAEWGAEVSGETESALTGPKGNREFFLYLVDRT